MFFPHHEQKRYKIWQKWSSRSSHQRCSIKKVFLEISQNSQGNNCTRFSILIKLQVSGLQLIKKETLEQVFSCEFYEISKNTFFTEHLWTTASGVTPREIIKVAPQVKGTQEKFPRTWIREYSPRKVFREVLKPKPSMLQLSVYEKSACN